MVRCYPAFGENLWRFLTARGRYPYRCLIRTPTGTVGPTLYSSHDMLTVNEVFCRQDYRAGADLGVAVDIGANIGLATLYFLTRNAASRVYAYEPDSRNVPRLRRNLDGYDRRYRFEEAAVTVGCGPRRLGIEPTGRYGRLDQRLDSEIVVAGRDVNAILTDVIERESRIDLVKIDTEGSEAELVAAIRPDLLEMIGTIYYETPRPVPLHLAQFEHRFDCQTNRLRRRGPRLVAPTAK
jgi:FkbM family methyltransferase